MAGVIGKILDMVIGDNLREIVTEIFTNYTRVSTQICPPGIDGAPVTGDQGFASYVDGTGKTVTIGVYPDAQALPGELRLYGRDAAGAIVFEIWFKNDGSIEIGGDADNAIAYTDMKAAFDELKTDLNNLITAYNAHVHVTTAVVGGGGAPGVLAATTNTGTPSAADMSGAKLDDIKFP